MSDGKYCDHVALSFFSQLPTLYTTLIADTPPHTLLESVRVPTRLNTILFYSQGLNPLHAFSDRLLGRNSARSIHSSRRRVIGKRIVGRRAHRALSGSWPLGIQPAIDVWLMSYYSPPPAPHSQIIFIP
jgi:hypothetical protein